MRQKYLRSVVQVQVLFNGRQMLRHHRVDVPILALGRLIHSKSMIVALAGGVHCLVYCRIAARQHA